jgi:protein-S-isoprenylcysteine O-methyltransferase Ste14
MFRTGKAKNKYWILFKTLFQTAVFWSFFLFLIPQLILTLESAMGWNQFSSFDILGWLGFFLFGSLGLYSGFIMSWKGIGTPIPFDCANKLVIAGPYKYVRNPMAVSGIGQGVSVGLILGSFSVLIYAFLGAVLWQLFICPWEEKELETRFGRAYLDYKESTFCWIPTFNK